MDCVCIHFSLCHSLRLPAVLQCSSVTNQRNCSTKNADSLSLQRDLEGRASQSLHVVLAFLLPPEVRALPGSLGDPVKLTQKFLPILFTQTEKYFIVCKCLMKKY